MKKKNNKKTLLVLFLLIVVGTTIAYFSNIQIFENIFKTNKVPTIVTTEIFTSPPDWTPGDETDKTITTTNYDSEDNICLRVKFDESWESVNEEELPLTQNGNRAAIINYINQDKWLQASDGWYYYQVELSIGETSLSPIKSVTFNKDILGDLECTNSVDEETGEKVKTCKSTGDGYDGATYTLTITTEALSCNLVDNYWNPEYQTGIPIQVLYGEYNLGFVSNESSWTGLFSGSHVLNVKKDSEVVKTHSFTYGTNETWYADLEEGTYILEFVEPVEDDVYVNTELFADSGCTPSTTLSCDYPTYTYIVNTQTLIVNSDGTFEIVKTPVVDGVGPHNEFMLYEVSVSRIIENGAEKVTKSVYKDDLNEFFDENRDYIEAASASDKVYLYNILDNSVTE